MRCGFLRQLTQIDAEPSGKLGHTQTELRSALTSDMAPRTLHRTTGDRHHEDALQGRSYDGYVFAFLLLSHCRHELNVRLRLGVAKVLRRRAIAACAT